MFRRERDEHPAVLQVGCDEPRKLVGKNYSLVTVGGHEVKCKEELLEIGR